MVASTPTASTASVCGIEGGLEGSVDESQLEEEEPKRGEKRKRGLSSKEIQRDDDGMDNTRHKKGKSRPSHCQGVIGKATGGKATAR